MKKYLLTALAALVLVSCNQSAKTDDDQEKMNTVVTYFSATGTTAAVAELLAQAANANLLEIQPQTPYSDADLNWRDSTSRSSVEMKDLSSRPKIKTAVNAVADYDTVFVGFPIWWYTAPTIINTFFETVDLKGKAIYLFATSGGSTIDKAVEDLRQAYPELDIREGRTLNDISFEDLSQWIGELHEGDAQE